MYKFIAATLLLSACVSVKVPHPSCEQVRKEFVSAPGVLATGAQPFIDGGGVVTRVNPETMQQQVLMTVILDAELKAKLPHNTVVGKCLDYGVHEVDFVIISRSMGQGGGANLNDSETERVY